MTDERDQIRKASLDDIAAIVALTNEAYAPYVPLLGRKPLPMTTDYREMVVDHSVWVSSLPGALAGVLVLVLEPDAMLVYSVAVSPSYQRRGLGHRLLMWAEKQAMSEGRPLLRLYTNARMTENIAWYERLGYAEVRRETFAGSELVHLGKRLAIAQLQPTR
jgi:ribosomal protein S18 acetylase RimI-like enzyme